MTLATFSMGWSGRRRMGGVPGQSFNGRSNGKPRPAGMPSAAPNGWRPAESRRVGQVCDMKPSKSAVGATVEILRQQLTEARRAEDDAQGKLDQAVQDLQRAGEGRAVADEKAQSAETVLGRSRAGTRAQAVAWLQRFAETSLLSAALPHDRVAGPRHDSGPSTPRLL